MPSKAIGAEGEIPDLTKSRPLEIQQDRRGEARDTLGRLTLWNGQQVLYLDGEPCLKGGAGLWQRIWFPDPPQWNKEPEIPVEAYDEKTRAAYQHVKERGFFEDDVMPQLPPRREWCDWGF